MSAQRPRPLRPLSVILTLFTALAGCQESSFDPDGGSPRVDGGRPASDGGRPLADGGGTKGCLVDGVLRPVGASFPASDGCNTCSCLESGQAVCTLRACPAPGNCGGLGGASCTLDQFCAFPPGSACGAADAQGTCTTPPSACNRLYAPVCGCDGRTYANECLAQAARTSVASQGECTSAGACKVDADCPQADCACLDANHDGSCENHCPTLGCRAGSCVDVSQGVACGGIAGFACGVGQFCDYGASCGFADQTGTCQRLPQACDLVHDPVCGCDGKTYSNLCLANMAGVNAKTRGACGTGLPAGASCGGLTPPGAPTCTSGTFCQHQPGAACGAADAPGVCTAIPDVCTDLYAPVCGCDGKTYPNACDAAAAQMGILANGACP